MRAFIKNNHIKYYSYEIDYSPLSSDWVMRYVYNRLWQPNVNGAAGWTIAPWTAVEISASPKPKIILNVTVIQMMNNIRGCLCQIYIPSVISSQVFPFFSWYFKFDQLIRYNITNLIASDEFIFYCKYFCANYWLSLKTIILLKIVNSTNIPHKLI